MIGPLEAGRLVSSLSGYVETLVAMGEVVDSLGDITEEERSITSKEDGDREDRDEERGQLSAEWGGAGGVAGRVCQVRDFGRRVADVDDAICLPGVKIFGAESAPRTKRRENNRGELNLSRS